MLQKLEPTWCEYTAFVALFAIGLVIGPSFWTVEYWSNYAWPILRLVGGIWLFLRIIDLMFAGPRRRSDRRYRAELSRPRP